MSNAHPNSQGEHITIIVNGQPKHVTKDTMSFGEIVVLAFGTQNPNTTYTMIYARGPEDNPKGTMSDGDTVKIKSGMVFNVTPTDKS